MTMSVQTDRNRVATRLIGVEPLIGAKTAAGPTDRERPPRQTGQARLAFRKRRLGAKQSIDAGTVAARLNRLFDTVRPPGRGPLRNYEVLDALRTRGVEMSAPYLSQLRSGRRSHPSLDMLRPLADFFGVSVAYFTDVDSAYTRYVDAELCWLEVARDPQVRELTTALLELPPDVREEFLKSIPARDSVVD
ncbi:hypothetical protein MAUB1S_05174 [Mycolicibacterium aubagnense]